MDFYDYIINRNAAQEKNPGKLFWKGGVPHRVINGKDNFLKLMSQV